ncbi:MAG TPA: divalent metal cation transporter [Ktedonobacterales bacterium]
MTQPGLEDDQERSGEAAQPVGAARAPGGGRRPHRGRPHFLPRVNRALRIIGPGLITGAADDDPSGIGTYSQTGAAYGHSQLWLALYMLPLMIAVQEMCGRIGLVTGKGLAAVIRERYSRWVLFGVVALVVIANTLNIGADLGAMAATLQLFAPSAPFDVLTLALAVAIVLLEVFVPYRHYAVVLKLLALSLLAYVATGLIVGFNSASILAATFIPSIQFTPAFLSLVVGVLGTTISPYLFFWQASEEVEELTQHQELEESDASGVRVRRPRWRRLIELRDLRIDTALGMIASEIATWFIIYTTGAVLYAHGVTNIATPDQAAAALEPLVRSFPHAGTLAEAIFALGIMGVGLLGVPVLAGSAAYAVAEALRWREGLWRPATHARGFYAVIAAATLIGMGLNLLHINPMAALVYVAIINGVVAVPLLVMILLVANNRAIMRAHVNGRLSNTVGWFTALAMGAAAVATVAALFFPAR